MDSDQKNVALSLVANAIWALGAALIALLVARLLPPDWNARMLRFSIRIDELIYLIAAVTSVVVFLSLALWRRRSRSRSIKGREEAMMANGKMIENYARDSTTQFWSTRLTHWRIAENSSARLKFRNIVSSSVAAGVPVRRLWQLQTLGDLKKLEEYLLLYSPYENYSVKAIVSHAVLLPELIWIDGKAAAISFPEPSTPRAMNVTLQFFGRDEVVAVKNYFEILWELATPIKIGAHIHTETLESFRVSLPKAGAAC